MKNVTTATEFDDWLACAKKGDRAVYFEGFMLRERLGRPYASHSCTEKIPTNIALAQRVWGMQLARRVILYQKRIGSANFQYIVHKI